MRKIVKRKEIAVKKAVVVMRTLLTAALLLSAHSACMHVQAAEETPVQPESSAEENAPEEEAVMLQEEGTAEEILAQETCAEEEMQAQEAVLAKDPQTQETAAEETAPPQPLSVTMVGDSVMLGGSPSILAMMPDCVIDAKVSRQFVQAGSVLDSLEQQGLLRQTVVIGLGTNGSFAPAKGQELINRLGSERTIYWVTVYGRELSWQEDSNAAIRKLAEDNENVHIIDWAQAVSGHPEWLCADGIHLSAAGRDAYANIVLGGLF